MEGKRRASFRATLNGTNLALPAIILASENYAALVLATCQTVCAYSKATPHSYPKEPFPTHLSSLKIAARLR